MLVRLLKLPLAAFRSGQIFGMPVTRNPIAWTPFFLTLPLAMLALILFYIFVYPLLILWTCIALYIFSRKSATFSENGVTFTKAYGRKTIPWTKIREVVHHREPASLCYCLICDSAERSSAFIVSSTPDEEAFERAITERGIPFRIDDWRDRGRAGLQE